MINHEYAELFNKDNVKKQLIIDFDGGQITNNRIYSEAFELKESLCSQSELRFGSCEASVLKLKIRNEFGELKNKWLTVSTILDGNADIPFQFGRYKVYSDEPSGDKQYKNITAYDAMYDIINADVAEWYSSLEFPITLKEFRDSFFEYFGIIQEETELILDSMTVEETISTTSISGKDIITAICELNGVFGHINRQDNFEYISLVQKKNYLYPNNDLYPSDDLYPGQMLDAVYDSHEIAKGLYESCEYEDFETSYISKLQIRQEEDDIGAIYGDGNNCYIIEDNFLVYGKTSRELENICLRLYGRMCGISYRPFKATTKGNPCLEVGDIVVFHTRYKDVEGYVLERTLKGIQSLKDTFESKGVYEYEEKVNSVQKDIKQLKGKTNVLQRTVEETKSTISNVEKKLSTQIKQNEEEIELKAAKDEIIALINLSAELAKIKAAKIALEGLVTVNENFKVLEDGSIVAKNGTFEGAINSSSANITGGSINISTDEDTRSIITLRSTNSRTHFAPYGFELVRGEEYAIIRTNWILLRNSPTENIFSIADYGCYIYSDKTVITGNLAVDGTKSRLAKTKSYNDRLLYCYEMPSPIFGDVGHGVIGEDGLCYVDIDQVFFETIDTEQSYQVFLQSYSEHNVYVKEKQQEYFVVKGEPNTEFAWEMKAKQLDFPLERLEEKMAEDNYQETDYVASASEYLNEYEKEVLNYE